mmetsp:Transcript_29541/g.68766  ORF Transcript_29541/g.68766 Transcript_29541/m.68766 type:complete len:299 (+) Transcript_29541:537-1433(+)
MPGCTLPRPILHIRHCHRTELVDGWNLGSDRRWIVLWIFNMRPACESIQHIDSSLRRHHHQLSQLLGSDLVVILQLRAEPQGVPPCFVDWDQAHIQANMLLSPCAEQSGCCGWTNLGGSEEGIDTLLFVQMLGEDVHVTWRELSMKQSHVQCLLPCLVLKCGQSCCLLRSPCHAEQPATHGHVTQSGRQVQSSVSILVLREEIGLLFMQHARAVFLIEPGGVVYRHVVRLVILQSFTVDIRLLLQEQPQGRFVAKTRGQVDSLEFSSSPVAVRRDGGSGIHICTRCKEHLHKGSGNVV